MTIDPRWTAITEDSEAWQNNPKHRWVYDRLLVASTQAYACGPLGVNIDKFPVVIKPITNIDGMSIGAGVATEAPAYRPGFMWCDVLAGEHVSTDVLVEQGVILWCAHAIGYPSPTFGRFEAWELLSDDRPELAAICRWINEHLPSYSGPLNFETIGGHIIEVHLRLTADWQRAGVYGTYSGPPRPAVGIPLFGATPAPGAFIGVGAIIDPVKDADRLAFVVLKP